MDRKKNSRRNAQKLVREGQTEKAIEAFEEYMAAGDADPFDHVYLGDLYLKAKRTEKAIPCCENGIAAYARLGFHRNAIALCRKILRLDPQHLTTQHRLGEFYMAEGLVGDAVHAFLGYLEHSSEEERLSECYRETLRNVEELAPARAELAMRAGELLQDIGYPEAAAGVLRRAAQRAGEAGASAPAEELQQRAAQIEASGGAMLEPGEAREQPASGAEGWSPESEGSAPEPDAPEEAASTASELRSEKERVYDLTDVDSDEAESALQMRVDGDPSTYGEVDLRAADASTEVLELAAGLADEAAGVTAEMVAGGGERAMAGDAGPEAGTRKPPVDRPDFATHYTQGMALLEAGRVDEAIAEFETASGDYDLSSEQALQLQEARGRCLSRLGRHREAIREIYLALEAPGTAGMERADLLCLLALEHEAVGDLDEAKRRLREALELRPDFAEAAERLAELETAA